MALQAIAPQGIANWIQDHWPLALPLAVLRQVKQLPCGNRFRNLLWLLTVGQPERIANCSALQAVERLRQLFRRVR